MSDEINDWSGRAPGGTGSVVFDEAGYYRDMAEAYKLTAEERADEIRRLRSALEWYADPDRHEEYRDHDPGCHPDGGCVGTCGEYLSDVGRDSGDRARQALKRGES